MSTEVKVRRIGNSLGVIFPKEFVDQKHLKLNDAIHIEVAKIPDYNKFFGKLKTKMTAQQFKDLAREGWEKSHG